LKPGEFQRFVLLNRLVSTSSTRAPAEHKAPTIPGAELLEVLKRRKETNVAIEFLGVIDSEKDAEAGDEQRITRGAGHDFIWLREIRIVTRGNWRYATLLFEFVDQSKESFSVVDTKKLSGRQISGQEDERGSLSAHVVIRLPIKQYDDGTYRCAIEAAHSITRSQIERFLSRQVGRWSTRDRLTFEVNQVDKRGRAIVKEYRYNPKLELFADFGRSVSLAAGGGRELAHMTFTKRSERQSIGKGTHAIHKDVIADVEVKVSARQGPPAPQERFQWLKAVRASFEDSGYETRLYYRHLNGGIISGAVHQALAGAADLMMCQKEVLALSHPPKDWYPEIDDAIADQMATFLDKDELWERGR
jgi:hypothetical protein